MVRWTEQTVNTAIEELKAASDCCDMWHVGSASEHISRALQALDAWPECTCASDAQDGCPLHTEMRERAGVA